MKSTLKYELIAILGLLALAGIVDYFLRLAGNDSVPNLSLICATLQMLAFMKIYIDKNQPLFAFLLLIFSMLCMIYTFAQVYSRAGFYEANGTISYDFFGAMYLSIVTWTTLGYGDLRPTEAVRMLTGIEALAGYLYLGIFVAFVLNYLFPRREKDRV